MCSWFSTFLVLSGLAVITFRQTAYWQNNISLWTHTLECTQDNYVAHTNLGLALAQQGRAAEAMLEYRKVLETVPGSATAFNNMAWLLATCPDRSLRDGAKAVQLAERAQSLTQARDAGVLDTLAAAYAAAGQFSSAVQTAQTALQLAEAQSNTALASALRREIKLYEAGHPLKS